MGRLFRGVIMAGIAVLLAACAATSALESQSRQRDSRLARMYFLRESGVLGAMGGRSPAAEIKVAGKSVGAVTSGSYIFVDRPPGLYKLSVDTGLSVAFETEVQVDAGREYYFNIGSPRSGAPGTDLLNQAFAGGKGQQMQGQSALSSALAGTVFFSLDPAAGADEVGRLKAP
jgi:hypothetical protein